MIRYVGINKEFEVKADRDCFAFFNTVNDKFVEIGGDCVFVDRDDLNEALECDASPAEFRDKLLSLIPEGRI